MLFNYYTILVQWTKFRAFGISWNAKFRTQNFVKFAKFAIYNYLTWASKYSQLQHHIFPKSQNSKLLLLSSFLDSSIFCIIEYIWILFGSFPKNWRKEWGNPKKCQFLGFAKFALIISRNNISHHVVRNSHFAKFLSIVVGLH